MNEVNVICQSDVDVKSKNLPCVAVDAGLLYAKKHNLKILQVIGDFDSLNNDEYLKYQDILIKADSEKNESDLQLALNYLQDFKGKINVYGALGKRMDHTLVNFKLCYYCDLDIHLIDKHNEIYRLMPGENSINKTQYKYISFLAFEDCNITIKGFKYNLNNYLLYKNDNITLSNELIDSKGNIINDKRVLVFLCKD